MQTVSSTYANRSNLAPQFFADTVSLYEGTRLGRQELHGEILEDVPGALWNHERTRRATRQGAAGRRAGSPPWKRVLIAVDPAVSSGEDAAETGIVVVAQGEDEAGYVLGPLGALRAAGVGKLCQRALPRL